MGIGYYKKMEIKCITEKLSSKKYIDMIKQINTCAIWITGNKYIFQHDNASVHTTKAIKHAVKQYFAVKQKNSCFRTAS